MVYPNVTSLLTRINIGLPTSVRSLSHNRERRFPPFMFTNTTTTDGILTRQRRSDSLGHCGYVIRGRHPLCLKAHTHAPLFFVGSVVESALELVNYTSDSNMYISVTRTTGRPIRTRINCINCPTGYAP